MYLVYDKLSEELRADPDILIRLPCMEHWDTLDMNDHIDGPAPRRLDCHRCILERSKKRWGRIVEGEGAFNATI